MLTPENVKSLIGMIASAHPDKMDCDSCYEKIAEFAELHLLGKELPEALQTVHVHLEQCPCCQVEFEALIRALKSLDDS